jgi:hypothetical protein
MKKNSARRLFLGIAVLLTAAMFTMAGCGDPGGGSGGGGGGNPGDNRQFVTYVGKDNDDNIYALTITQKSAGKVAYAPQGGDAYVLTKGGKKENKGTVKSSTGGVLTLALKADPSKTFTATVSGTGMTDLSGDITWTDTSDYENPTTATVAGPGSLTALEGSDDTTPLVGIWTKKTPKDEPFAVEFTATEERMGWWENGAFGTKTGWSNYTYRGTTLIRWYEGEDGDIVSEAYTAQVSGSTLTISGNDEVDYAPGPGNILQVIFITGTWTKLP